MEVKMSVQVQRCQDQYREFKEQRRVWNSEILKFDGVEGADVYNPSVPFAISGEIFMAGRVEKREGNISKTVFFKERNGIWIRCDYTPVFDLEDPFVVKIGEEIILGGVRVIRENNRIISWITDFYRGKDLNELRLFASGPSHMKDIRLIGLPSGKIGVFTRPQGQKMIDKYGCIAKIGFTLVDSLEQVTAEVIENAPFIEGQFLPDEWGGCNQLHILKNGLIGVVGHKSWGEGSVKKILHYYAMAFAIDADSRRVTPCKIICSRDSFPEGPAKRPELKDVTFTAGLIRNDDKTATLYAGLSDCQVGKADIQDPFLEYEMTGISNLLS
jgi:hypothetical protein